MDSSYFEIPVAAGFSGSEGFWSLLLVSFARHSLRVKTNQYLTIIEN